MLGEPNFAVQDASQPALLGAELPHREAHAMHPGRQRRTCRIGGNRASWWPPGSHNGAAGRQMRAAPGRPAARLPLVLPPLALLLLQGGAAADMAYSEPMRLQSPPESITTPELKCSVCVVSCDAIRHELQAVTKWTESRIMEAFESAVALLGDQYGFSDAEGMPQYIQVRAPAPAAVAAPAGGLSRRADVLRRGAEYRWPRASRSGRSSRTSWRRCRESSRTRCWPVRDGAAPLSFRGLRWLTGGAVRAGYQNDGMCVHSARPFCRSTLLISLLLCRDFRREFCVTRNKGALPPLALRTLCS